MRDHRGRLIGMLAGSVVLGAACVAVQSNLGFAGGLRRPGAVLSAIYPVGAVLLPIASLLLAWRLWKRPVRLVFDPTGLTDRRWGFGLIPWADVRAARVARSDGLTYLCLAVNDPAKAHAGRTPVRNAVEAMLRDRRRPDDLRPDEIAIPVGSLDLSPPAMLKLLSARLGRTNGASG